MTASLLKLLTIGIQNERLIFKKTLYPFIKVWYRTGRFTTQWVRLDFDYHPQFGQTATFRITRKGQLCTRLYLVATMPDILSPQAAAVAATTTPSAFAGPTFGWTNDLGHALISNLTLDIGGTRVEQLDSRLLELLDEFYTPLEKTTAVNRLIKRLDTGFTQTSLGYDPRSPEVQTITALPFWFTRGDAAAALPVDAITIADEIRCSVTFRPVTSLYYTDSRTPTPTLAIPNSEGTALWPILNSPFYEYSSAPIAKIVPGINRTRPVIPISGHSMPRTLNLGETYILAEYIYLDQPEANLFRLGDLQYPITQHYRLKPYDTRGLPRARVPIDIPNPTRDLFWLVQRTDAPNYNAHFLATRDLYGPQTPQIDASGQPIWWPNAEGLSALYPGYLYPAFAFSDSEPSAAVALQYEGTLTRFRTEAPALFRSVLPSYELKKSPWINRFYYNIPFGAYNGYTPPSRPRGEANMDKISKNELLIELRPLAGQTNPNAVPDYTIYTYAETYNILRVYGGRAGLLFAY